MQVWWWHYNAITFNWELPSISIQFEMFRKIIFLFKGKVLWICQFAGSSNSKKKDLEFNRKFRKQRSLIYYKEIQWNSVITNSVINRHILGQIAHFSTQINPVVTSPSYSEQTWQVRGCLIKLSLTVCNVSKVLNTWKWND